MAPIVALTDASLTRSGRNIFNGIFLSVTASERVALLGPSGVGKSSLLNVLAGQLPLSSGQMIQDAKKIVLMQQRPALLPWLSARENVALAARLNGVKPDLKRISELLDRVGLHSFAQFKPHELSGGQQQRVALARALYLSPDLLLLDEPFSALDPEVKAKLRADLDALQEQSGFALVLVTHDPTDAIGLCQRHLYMTQHGLFENALKTAA